RAGSECLSACALAFLGGSESGPESSSLISRQISGPAKLGFHAPFPQLPERTYTKAELETMFAAAFSVVADFLEKAERLHVARRVAPKLLQPTQDQFFEISNIDRLGLFRIGLTDEPNVTKVNRRMIIHACINNYHWTKNESSES